MAHIHNLKVESKARSCAEKLYVVLFRDVHTLPEYVPQMIHSVQVFLRDSEVRVGTVLVSEYVQELSDQWVNIHASLGLQFYGVSVVFYLREIIRKPSYQKLAMNLFTRDILSDLPFHIITNILLRLPAKCIFQLRQHTRSTDLLYDLTTDPYFMRAHLDQARATPTIVVQSRSQPIDNCIELFLFDDKAEYVEATSFDLSSYGEECPTDLWGSYDGFLLFTSQAWHLWQFCIWNPITKEQVTVTSPSRLLSVCGFYFHPCKKEYEVVVCRYAARKFDFQILNLRTKHRRSVGSCSYPPSTRRPPVFINGTFYWMVDCLRYGLWNNYVRPSLSDSILSFNIETEEFITMEAAVPCNYTPTQRRYPGNEFQLFDLEGELSLFDPSSITEVFIWVFNNNTKHWDKKHSVISPCHQHKWYFYSYFTEFEYIKMKGEFITYHWLGTRKYIYNLSSGTWKLFEKKEFEKDRFTTTIHTQSLVSLDAADSVIPLENIDV